MKELYLKIRGRVQGVSFRYSAKQKADELGLAGWARNDPDGTLTIVAQGEEETLRSFAGWCRDGSPAAKVAEITEEWRPPREFFDAFEIRR